MAGDWIKVEDCLPDKPEVIAIADILQIDQDAVVGKLIRIWVWADQQTYSGDAPSVTRAFLDRHTNCSGFASAMHSVGWLIQKESGFTFPNFEYHNGETAKRRALTAKRNRVYRAKSDANRDAPRDAASVISASPREEKRRVLNTPPNPRKRGHESISNRRPTRREKQRAAEQKVADDRARLDLDRRRESEEAGIVSRNEWNAALKLWGGLTADQQAAEVAALMKQPKWKLAGEDLAREFAIRSMLKRSN